MGDACQTLARIFCTVVNHLIRDMNDDLLNHPFDQEYKIFVQQFGILLKSIIKTIDEYGLRKQYLSKHKIDVKVFFEIYVTQKTKSLVTERYRKRFMNNENKLFTFLDYDGIPWNNNNAEYAIKEFAIYRKLVDGLLSEDGIREYLTLLSLYKTCEYKNVNFLKFLLSGKKDIEKFRKRS